MYSSFARWQRVALSWSLAKGLTLYMDGNFRGATKLPKSVPIVARKASSEFIIGKKMKDSKLGSAEFAISSLAVYERYLTDNDMGGLFGDKSKWLKYLKTCHSSINTLYFLLHYPLFDSRIAVSFCGYLSVGS